MNVFEVFFISLCIYIYLSVLLRIFGKKEFSQLNVFDFVVFLIIAEIMTDTVLLICLKELECMDFLINAMTNPYKEAGYAIRPLGLEYVKRYIL